VNNKRPARRVHAAQVRVALAENRLVRQRSWLWQHPGLVFLSSFTAGFVFAMLPLHSWLRVAAQLGAATTSRVLSSPLMRRPYAPRPRSDVAPAWRGSGFSK